MNKECPACNQDPCVCDDVCDSCGAQMEQVIPPELRQHTAALKARFKVIQDGMK